MNRKINRVLLSALLVILEGAPRTPAVAGGRRGVGENKKKKISKKK